MKKEIKLINEIDPEKIDLPRDLPGTVLLQEKKFGSRTLFFDYARFLYGQGTMSNSVLCRTVEPGQGMLRLAGEAEIAVLNGFLPENLRKVMSYDYINHWKSTGINLGLFLEILFADEEKRKLPRKMRNSQRFDRAMRVVNLSPNTAENRLDLYKRLYATVPAHEAAHFIWSQLPADLQQDWFWLVDKGNLWNPFRELTLINRPKEEAFCLTVESIASPDDLHTKIYRPDNEQTAFVKNAVEFAEKEITRKLELYKKDPVKALQLFAIEKRMRDLEDLKLLHQQWGKDTGEDDKLYAFW